MAHPSAQALLDLFDFKPLPALEYNKVEKIRENFKTLAQYVVDFTPSGPEQTTALRHLMEAKDSAVRAVVAEAMKKEKLNFGNSPGQSEDMHGG